MVKFRQKIVDALERLIVVELYVCTAAAKVVAVGVATVTVWLMTAAAWLMTAAASCTVVPTLSLLVTMAT